jgi:nitrous oxidase accessory protein
MSYWTGTYRFSERRWILVAALVLLPVFFLPILPVWIMKLWAPQYPEGLTLRIYAHTIQGDLQKINTLNHYVGMHPIHPDDFAEFRYMPQLLTFFGVMALLAALVNRRWVALLGWLGFTAFAAYMFRDYANWLWHYGHDLDPRAAIKMGTFTPPLIGYQKMANFKVWSLPGPGTLLLGFAWLLGPFVYWMERRAGDGDVPATSAANDAAQSAAILLLLGACLFAPPASAAVIQVPAIPGAASRALATASPGDTVLFQAGIHPGPLRIQRSLTLRGEPGATILGGDPGAILSIEAGDVVVEDLSILRSGNRVITVDCGVRVESAPRVRLERLVLRDVLYGIYVERSDGLVVRHCRLTGRVKPLDGSGAGNGIHLWYSADARLTGNTVERFADGIYLSFADRIAIDGNELRDSGRYGLHTMYNQDNQLVGNRFTRNLAGCAIMFSNHLRVLRNDFLDNRGPRTYGLLLRDCSAGLFEGNRLVDNTVAMFLDDSNRNEIRDNLVQDNGWGLLLFSSCEGNLVTGNQFLNNDYPVALDMRRSDNRFDDGRRGNFWSDNAPYDLDADGISDVPYSPVSAFSFLSKQYPDLSLLAHSPAVLAITVAERVFPSLRPSEIVDNRPLVAPVAGKARSSVAVTTAGPTKPVWGAVLAFGGLLLTGASALIAPRRGR